MDEGLEGYIHFESSSSEKVVSNGHNKRKGICMAAFMEGSGIEARKGNFCIKAGPQACLGTITSHQGTFPSHCERFEGSRGYLRRYSRIFPTEPPVYANDYYVNSAGIVTDSFISKGVR